MTGSGIGGWPVHSVSTTTSISAAHTTMPAISSHGVRRRGSVG